MEKEINYQYKDLCNMSLQQLRALCRKEKIVDVRIHLADQEQLLQVVLEALEMRRSSLLIPASEADLDHLQELLLRTELTVLSTSEFTCPATLTVYEGFPLKYEDGLWFPYESQFANTNVLLVDEKQNVCGLFHLKWYHGRQRILYLSKSSGMHCRRPEGLCDLYFFDRRSSAVLQRAYKGEFMDTRLQLSARHVCLNAFNLEKPMDLEAPLAIAFGSDSTVVGSAGAPANCICNPMLKREAGRQDMRFLLFGQLERNANREFSMPSIAGVFLPSGKPVQFYFGTDAFRIDQSIYNGRGYYLFWHIRDWVDDLAGVEVLFDSCGNQVNLCHQDLLAAYFEFLILLAEDQWKCKIKRLLFLGSPLERAEFSQLARECLPQYILDYEGCYPTGIAHLQTHVTQSERIEDGSRQEYLLLDCDDRGCRIDFITCHFGSLPEKNRLFRQSAARFHMDHNERQLTHRIFQLLKIQLAIHFAGNFFSTIESVEEFFARKPCFYLQEDRETLFGILDRAYELAEKIVPTRYGKEKKKNGVLYYKIKRNYNLLFQAAQQMLSIVYHEKGIERILFSTRPLKERQTQLILAERGALSIELNGILKTLPDFPVVGLDAEKLQFIVRAVLFQRFFMAFTPLADTYEPWLRRAKVVVGGQGAGSELFRDVLKEFVPGCNIEISDAPQIAVPSMLLRAVEYVMTTQQSKNRIELAPYLEQFPYTVIACDCRGDEAVLFPAKNNVITMVTRQFASLTSIRFYCKDAQDAIREDFVYCCSAEEFEADCGDFDQLNHIAINQLAVGEIGFFVSRVQSETCYILPVYRAPDGLHKGKEKGYSIRKGSAVDFFDGLK